MPTRLPSEPNPPVPEKGTGVERERNLGKGWAWVRGFKARAGSEDSPQPSFSPGARWSIASRVLISAVACLAVVVMVNYIATRHFKRFEWTARHSVQLSPMTLRVLGALTNQVNGVVLFDRSKALFSSVKDLLTEYQRHCPKLDVEYVDYSRSPGRAKIVLEHYRLTPSEEGDCVLFEGNGKTRVVFASQLSEYDQKAILRGEEVKRTGFKGEQLFSSALYSIIDPKPVIAYFLQEHAEHDPTEQGSTGYSAFARVLAENNVLAKILPGLVTNDVPADCQLLVIAGPARVLDDSELERIDKYLSQGGRLFVLFNWSTRNVRTGLEKILENWGVEVGHNTIRDEMRNQAGNEQTVIANQFGNHPIVNPLRDSTIAMVLPRSIRPRPSAPSSAGSPKVVALVSTSASGVAVVDAGGPPARVESERSSIPLAVAVEQGVIPEISAGRATRLVVTGDSFFLQNNAIDFAANRDFVRNAVHWLVNRELLLEGIGPRPITEYRVAITERELAALRWILLGGLPGGVLIVGWFVWLRRRS